MKMGIQVGVLPGLPLPARAWVSVALVISTTVVLFTVWFLPWLPVEDIAMGFHLDAAVPGPESPPAKFERAAVRFEQADPVMDATRAIDAGDTRLWAVKADGWFVPGGLDGQADLYRRRYGLRFWQEGCIVHTDAELRFRQAIASYAARYNATMFEALDR